MSYPPYTPDEIKALGLDYRAQNLTINPGWTKEGLALVLHLGYSVAEVHNLRPSSRDWTPAQLLQYATTLTPYVLDPRLISCEEIYTSGYMKAEGFEPNANLSAEREKSLLKLKASKAKVEKSSEKPCNPESKKRQARDTSESSGTSYFTERKSRQPRGQNLKAKEAEGGNISYVNSNYDLLKHSNDQARVKFILDNRSKILGSSVTGTVIVNDSEIPHIDSATQKKSDSRCSRLYNPQGTQNNTMDYSKLLEDAAVKPDEYKVWCEQCLDQHPVHKQYGMLIIFVTDDRELAKGTKFYMGGPQDKTFGEICKKGALHKIRPYTLISWTCGTEVPMLTT